MALNVGELVAYMSVDDTGVARGVKDGESRLRRFGATATKIAAGIGTAFALIGAGAFVKDIVGAASDLNETQSKIQNQFGASAAAIQDWAKVADGALGQSQQQALDAASSFATFGKAASLTGKDLVGFSEQSVKLASDLASFFNTDPSVATEAISAALRGESEPIRQFGVLLDQNVIKAEAVRKGFVKAKVDVIALGKAQFAATDAQRAYSKAVAEHGRSSVEAAKAGLALRAAQEKLADAVAGTVPDLTKQQQILATQAAIIDQTKDAQGDFARTSSGLANQQRILAARFANVKATLGQQLLPVALKIASALQDILKWGEANKSWLVPTITIVGGLAAAIYLIVKATQAWTVAQAALDVVLDANPIGLIVLGVAALIAIIVLIATKTTWFQTIWRVTWGGIKTAAEAVGHWFAGPFAGFFVRLYNDVIGWFKGLGRWFTETLPNGLRAAGQAVFAAVTWPWRTANEWIMSHVIGPTVALPEKIAGGLKTGKDKIAAAWKSIINYLIGAWNKLDFGIHISLPDWLPPPFGGKSFNVDDLIPDIPMLARGGLVQPRPGGTPAILGEAGQAEIASPVPMLRRIVAEELGRAVRAQTVTLIIEGTGMLRGIRKVARIGGGRADVVLVGGAG